MDQPNSDDPLAAAGEIVLAWLVLGVTHLDRVLLVVQILAGIAVLVFTVLRIVFLLRGPNRPPRPPRRWR